MSIMSALFPLGSCRILRNSHGHLRLHVQRSLSTSSCLCYKSRKSRQNYYQVLGVDKAASSKDIRNAFLELSKSCHPDKNSQTTDNHEKFVQINEAYSVLSKPLLRQDYDQSLSVQSSNPWFSHQHTSGGTAQQGDEYYYDSQFYAYRDKTQDKFYEKKPYYGVHGISKVSNRALVSICMVIILLGVMVHSFVVKRLSDLTIEHLNERDKKIFQLWANANDPDYNTKQVEKMKIIIEERQAQKKD